MNERVLIVILSILLLTFSTSSVLLASADLPDIDGYTVLQDGMTNLGHVAILYKDVFVTANNGIRFYRQRNKL